MFPPGGMAGTITATAATHTAVGLVAFQELNGGGSRPLSVSGTIAARANGLAVAVASDGAMNLYVTGILSGVDTSGSGEGYAIRAGSPRHRRLEPGKRGQHRDPRHRRASRGQGRSGHGREHACARGHGVGGQPVRGRGFPGGRRRGHGHVLDPEPDRGQRFGVRRGDRQSPGLPDRQ
jgi:hypothetical protein